jgi:thymidylate kinase
MTIKYQKTRFKGKLIAFEGLSGSGKTECSEMLANELLDRGYKVHIVHLNSFDNNLVQKLHNAMNEIKYANGYTLYNRGDVTKAQSNLPSYQKREYPVDYVVIHGLFMLYLFSIRKEIMHKLSVCDYVIVDQWVYKNIVYSLLNKVPKNYIMNMVRNILPKPFLVIFLDLHEIDALKKTKDMYEDMHTLREVKTNYYQLRKYARERWLTVNLHGNETTEDIVYKRIIPSMKKNI